MTSASQAAPVSPFTPLRSPVAPEQRHARAGLSRFDADDARLHALVRSVGVVAAWRQVRERLPAAVEPQQDLERWTAAGGRTIAPGDAEWPAALDDLDRDPSRECAPAPLLLWVRGPLPLTEVAARGVAMVGARAATAYGTHVASGLATDLAERGWPVVSGGAYGVDVAAHRGALAAQGPTVAVLAAGADVAYPRGNSAVLERIAASGLVVSEVPPGTTPTRRRFLTRNRLIAALGLGTVVVEAAARSGALRTAANAVHLGRVCAVVPGPVTSALSAGCHALARRQPQVRLVTTAAEIIEEVGALGMFADDLPVAASVRDGLADTARRLLDAFPARAPIGVAQLAVAVGEQPGRVMALLGVLQEHGLVVAGPQGYRLTSLGRRPSVGGG